jgi:hypothetical protein
MTKRAKIASSIKSIKTNIIESTKIRVDFKIIPKTIEKATKPFLYSFLRGLKNVRTRTGRDSI